MSTSTLHLGIFYMPQICDMGPTALLPLRRKACWGFFRPLKIRRVRPGLNPRTWVLKASTLPLYHRSRHGWHIKNKFISLETTITCLQRHLRPCNEPCTKPPVADGGHQLANSYWYLWQTALQLKLHQPNCESACLGSIPSYSGRVQKSQEMICEQEGECCRVFHARKVFHKSCHRAACTFMQHKWWSTYNVK